MLKIKDMKNVQELQKKIIEMLKNKVYIAFWKYNPKNLITKKTYNGFNNIFLTGKMIELQTENPYFLTYNQAKEKNIQIEKGSKLYTVIFWSILEKGKKTENETGSEKSETMPILKYYQVFSCHNTNIKNDFEKINEIRKENLLESIRVEKEISEEEKDLILKIVDEQGSINITKKDIEKLEDINFFYKIITKIGKIKEKLNNETDQKQIEQPKNLIEFQEKKYNSVVEIETKKEEEKPYFIQQLEKIKDQQEKKINNNNNDIELFFSKIDKKISSIDLKERKLINIFLKIEKTSIILIYDNDQFKIETNIETESEKNILITYRLLKCGVGKKGKIIELEKLEKIIIKENYIKFFSTDRSELKLFQKESYIDINLTEKKIIGAIKIINKNHINFLSKDKRDITRKEISNIYIDLEKKKAVSTDARKIFEESIEVQIEDQKLKNFYISKNIFEILQKEKKQEWNIQKEEEKYYIENQLLETNVNFFPYERFFENKDHNMINLNLEKIKKVAQTHKNKSIYFDNNKIAIFGKKPSSISKPTEKEKQIQIERIENTIEYNIFFDTENLLPTLFFEKNKKVIAEYSHPEKQLFLKTDNLRIAVMPLRMCEEEKSQLV
jgi:hypothetical protein